MQPAQWGVWDSVVLGKALTTAFCPQILTQEDWNKVLYNGMASTSSWAALYFIALMTFGNYVLFNLLVAILVEGFQAEVTSCPQCTSARRNPLPCWGGCCCGGPWKMLLR